MLKVGTYAYCIDITGVHLVKIFKVLGAGSRNNSILGIMVMIAVNDIKNIILWMKITEVLKKTSKKTHKIYQRNTNRNYSRQDQFNNEGKKSIVDFINEQNKSNIKSKKFIKKIIEERQNQIKRMLKHPTIIEIIDIEGEKATVAIMNITTKAKRVLIDGKLVEVEYVGEIGEKKQYLVKAVIEVDVNTSDLEEGKIIEKTNKFGFSEETNKELINNVREIIKESELLIWKGEEGTSIKGNYKNKINPLENDLFDKFDN